MPEEMSDDYEDAVARESQEESLASLEKIGKHLQLKLAKIVGEPLPDEFHNLLNELKQRHDRN